MNKVITVCRSGGEYRSEHVERLRKQVEEHGAGAEFVCLDDDALRFGWPGWWSKMEAFGIAGPALYIDLDTTILKSLEPFFEACRTNDFIALRDFNPNQREMGSGLMGWSGDMSRLLEAFKEDPKGNMARCRTPKAWGDQGFIEPLTKGRAYWQSILPGKVVSWKKHCGNGIPPSAHIICFHGKPRPWDIGQ